MDQQIVRALKRLKGELHSKFGVTKIGCFNCYLSHHHNVMCDLNVLVSLEAPLGWRFFALKEFIENKLEIHIDIFTERSIKPALKQEIMSKIVFV